METVNKYKVVDKSHAKYGKIVKCTPNDNLEYVDVETGEVYTLEQVTVMPEKHAVYWGFILWRFGMYFFAREYMKYHSYQLGLSADWIKHDDAYLDLEIRVACFGAGIRFMWLSKASKLYAKINSAR